MSNRSLAIRLAQENAIGKTPPEAIVIGSDQIGIQRQYFGNLEILTKPLNNYSQVKQFIPLCYFCCYHW